MKLISLMLIPAMLAGQNGQLSEAARKLLSKPRLGDAQLTWSDGRKQDGVIMRVTDQFIVFENRYRLDCENVELSKIAGVRWLRTSGIGWQVSEVIFLSPFLAPFFVASWVAEPFQHMFPPLKPLSGDWKSGSHGGMESSLQFNGSTVRYSAPVVRRGRYSVDNDVLHMMFEGEPDAVSPFRFNCRSLILDNFLGTFALWSSTSPVAPPIVGDWHSGVSSLNFRQDGSLEERKYERRDGTFERTATGLKIHWAEGQEWTAQIKHRHIVVSAGGVTTEYHYVPTWEP